MVVRFVDIRGIVPLFELSIVCMHKSTFHNISVILWRSVLLVEKNGVFRNNHKPVASN